MPDARRATADDGARGAGRARERPAQPLGARPPKRPPVYSMYSTRIFSGQKKRGGVAAARACNVYTPYLADRAGRRRPSEGGRGWNGLPAASAASMAFMAR